MGVSCRERTDFFQFLILFALKINKFSHNKWLCLHGIKFSSMKGGGYQKGFINGCGVWHLHHSCQCHQFPPLIYTTANLGMTPCLFFFLIWKYYFFFVKLQYSLTGNSNQKTRLSKMTIVSSSTNQERKDYFVISVWSIGFLKGSRNYLGYLGNFTFLKTQNHYEVRRICAVFLQHQELAYILSSLLKQWTKSTGFSWWILAFRSWLL